MSQGHMESSAQMSPCWLRALILQPPPHTSLLTQSPQTPLSSPFLALNLFSISLSGSFQISLNLRSRMFPTASSGFWANWHA